MSNIRKVVFGPVRAVDTLVDSAAARMAADAAPQESNAAGRAREVAPKPLPVWLVGLIAAVAGFLAALTVH